MGDHRTERFERIRVAMAGIMVSRYCDYARPKTATTSIEAGEHRERGRMCRRTILQ